jgi:hypothetical protein
MGAVAQTVSNVVSDVVQSVGDAVQTISNAVSDAAQAVGDTVEKAAEAIGSAGADLDKVVNREIPGGWLTVGGVAATIATAGALGAGAFAAEGAGTAAEGVAAAESATAFAGGGAAATEAAATGATAAANSGWTLAGDAITKVATAAGSGALKGAGIGAATSLLAGKDPIKGAIKGAEFGGLTGGVGELGNLADLGSTATRLAQTAAPSLITGADPTKNLMNTAMSIGAGSVGGELGLDNQVSQTALSAGKALASGQDPTQALLKTAIGSAVGAGTNTFSSAFKDAIDNGMTPEQAYTVASQKAGEDTGGMSPADTGGISNQTTDENGNTIYTYDDGSKMTLSPQGEVIDATEAQNYQDTYADNYEEPSADQTDASTDEYKDSQGGLPTDVNKTLDTAAQKGTSALQSQANKSLTSTLTKALLPTAPVAKQPTVSKAQTARTTNAPANTLTPTQALATSILSGTSPTQATTGVMTPAERMAAIAKAFGGNFTPLTPTTTAPSQTAQPAQFSPSVFASGGTVDFSEEFIDKSSGVPSYLKPGITHGRGNYTMPGYPFGQLWRIGMAEGGEVEGHNPEFFSEGGLNSLENRYVKGDGDGTSDSIPAMLANGEFVIPADVVSGLGNGSNDSGAKVLDEFLKTIREHKQKTGADKLPPDSKGPLGYLLEANKKVKN